MERLRTTIGLLRARHTAQVAGIVTAVGLKSNAGIGQLLFTDLVILSLTISLFFLDDAHDYQSDMVVHPERAVPRGIIGQRALRRSGILLMTFAILLALTLPWFQLFFLLTIALFGLAVIYLRLHSYTRSMLTAYMIWALFPFGCGSMDAAMLLFGLIVALPHIGGNIAKDVIHSEGDQMIGLPPPSKKSRYIAGFAFLSCSVVSWFPAMLGLVNWLYVVFIFPTSLSCLFLGIRLLTGRFQHVYALGAVGMMTSLLALVFG